MIAVLLQTSCVYKCAEMTHHIIHSYWFDCSLLGANSNQWRPVKYIITI